MTLQNPWKNSRIRIWTGIIIFTVLLAVAAWASGLEDIRFRTHSRVTGFTAQKKGSALIALSWNPLEGADGYELFRYSSGQKKYLLIKDYHSGQISSHRDQDANAHRRQKYMIRAYRIRNGVKVNGEPVEIAGGGLNGQESIGHRGAMEYAPDDTIASFAKAKSLGYKNFECDIWSTLSGDTFVFHDPGLNRLTDGTGSPAKLSEDNYLSFPFTHGRNVDRYITQYPPDLDEVVSWAKDHDMNLILHLKESGYPHTYMSFYRIEKILSRHHMIPHSVVFTSNKNALVKMSKFSFRTGYLTALPTTAGRCGKVNTAVKYGCDLMIMKYTDQFPLTAKVVNYCHERGISIVCYNIDRYDQVHHLIDVRCDFWITNRMLFKRHTD